jgi:hypothetical protein
MQHDAAPRFDEHVRREHRGADLAFELPVRPLGASRWFGLFLVGFSVLFIWTPAGALLDHFARGVSQTGSPMDFAFTGFLALFVVVGLMPATYGLMMMFGRCRIAWRGERLRVTELLGPLRWTRRFPKGDILRFEIGIPPDEDGKPAVAQGTWAVLGAMRVHIRGQRPRVVAMGYPRSWLKTIADELSTAARLSPGARSPALVLDMDLPVPSEPQDDVPLQPPGSRCVLEGSGGGWRLSVPADGWRGPARALLVFALVWLGLVALAAASTSGRWPGFRIAAGEGVTKFLLVFGGIGWACFLGGIHLAIRRAVFLVDGGQLKVEQRGLFGLRRRTWRRDEIARIRVEGIGAESQGKPVLRLCLQLRVGGTVGFFTGRDAGELRWMATRLRQGLGLAPQR